ncbi:MAG: 50S ribosomal protein L21 [Lentisphaerae bacterium]|nr:50S ribosomal protein L21 [Lentisphaerota bacterium]
MESYAIVETSGRQYLVKAGDVLEVNRIEAEAGGKVDLAPVLAVSDGKDIVIGKPEVSGASVACSVVEHKRGPKLVSYKKKRRKGYARKIGHRQDLTVLKVEALNRA